MKTFFSLNQYCLAVTKQQLSLVWVGEKTNKLVCPQPPLLSYITFILQVNMTAVQHNFCILYSK